MFRDAHATGTLRVDVAGSTGIFMTLGCSDLQHGEALGTRVLASQQCGDVISQDEGME